MPLLENPRTHPSSRTASRLALAVCAVLISACASGPTIVTEDRCPAYGQLLADDAKQAYARGTFLQHRCYFAQPAVAEIRAEPPAVSAPAPVPTPAPVSRPPRISIDNASFGFDSTALTPEAHVSLRSAIDALRRYPELNVFVVGFTDSTGPESYNQGLSERRAMVARSFLIDAGVSPDRIEAVGAGEAPDSNNTSTGRARNRRVEIGVR